MSATPAKVAHPLGWARRYLNLTTGGAAAFPLVVLSLLYFFDQFDTAAFGVLAPNIEAAFHLSDSGFGYIVIANVSIVLVLAVPVAHLGDRLPRTRMVVVGGILAGVFSFLTGVVGGLTFFVLVRIGNGVGQLVNDPIHNSLLSDYYRPEVRPRVFAAHQNAVYLGGIIGPAVAGVVATLAGWHAAFMILIVPIVVTAVVALRLWDPKRGETDDAQAAADIEVERPVPLDRAARILFSVPTLRRQYVAWLFIGAGYIPLAFIYPLYLKRVYGLHALDRGLIIAAGAACSFAGVQLAGRWTPGWLAKSMGEPLRRAALVLGAVGVGLVATALAPDLPIALVLLFATNFVGGMFYPPFLTVQALVSPARVRSLSFGFGSLFLIAGVWVLWALPGISTISNTDGIRFGLGILAPYWLIGAAVLLTAVSHVTEDVQRALANLATAARLRRDRLVASAGSLLVIREVDVCYGPVQVLFGVDLTLAEGEILALLGTNGAGKSTLLKAICGQVPVSGGGIFFDGEDVTGLEPEDCFGLGIIQVPGGHGVFPGLTVRENLEVAKWASRQPRGEAASAVEEALALFPALSKRFEQPAA
ncbi:MAG: MFS transporter, partial [Acidimicrobiales bacterium]